LSLTALSLSEQHTAATTCSELFFLCAEKMLKRIFFSLLFIGLASSIDRRFYDTTNSGYIAPSPSLASLKISSFTNCLLVYIGGQTYPSDVSLKIKSVILALSSTSSSSTISAPNLDITLCAQNGNFYGNCVGTQYSGKIAYNTPFVSSAASSYSQYNLDSTIPLLSGSPISIQICGGSGSTSYLRPCPGGTSYSAYGSGLATFYMSTQANVFNPLISTVPCFYLSVTETALPSSSPTCTPSQTVIPTLSPSLTGTISSMAPTPTISMAESASSTPTPTMTPSPSPTGTVTVTISLTGTVTPILTPQASQEVSVTPSSTNTATVTVSETPTVTPSETPSVTPSISSSDSATSTLTVSVSSSLSPLSTDLGAGENIPKNQVGRNGFTVGEIGGITAGCIVCFVALLAFVSVVRSSSKKPLKSLHAKPNQFGEQVMMNGVLNSRVISVQVKETSRQDRIRSALDSRKGRL